MFQAYTTSYHTASGVGVDLLWLEICVPNYVPNNEGWLPMLSIRTTNCVCPVVTSFCFGGPSSTQSA